MSNEHISTMRGSRVGGGGGGQMVRTPPPGKSQKIGFLSNTDPDPKKITELPSQHSVFGHHRRFAGGPMIVIEVFGSFLPHQTKTKRQKKKKPQR